MNIYILLKCDEALYLVTEKGKVVLTISIEVVKWKLKLDVGWRKMTEKIMSRMVVQSKVKIYGTYGDQKPAGISQKKRHWRWYGSPSSTLLNFQNSF